MTVDGGLGGDESKQRLAMLEAGLQVGWDMALVTGLGQVLANAMRSRRKVLGLGVILSI